MDGRVVLGEESSDLRNTVKGLLAEDKKKIVLNVEPVGFIDSSGLGAFVAAITPPRRKAARWHFATWARNSKSCCR
ncbi:MAG TPA: STAS domain-containing protein [Candidatus Dormibacteraeota bacterium]|nr:STAS domain-containing protein [Candidatus Dormibacteraeota bacterium]